MSYVGGIVRILETPVLRFINNNISQTEFRVQFPQLRNEQSITIIKLVFWGNFAHDIVNYYRINDYILIEGYLSFRNNKSGDLSNKTLKHIEITVFKVYPLFLKGENSLNTPEELK